MQTDTQSDKCRSPDGQSCVTERASRAFSVCSLASSALQRADGGGEERRGLQNHQRHCFFCQSSCDRDIYMIWVFFQGPTRQL
ncbi:hypothetical protein QQF64_026600 [Cirrhinus molitorella]|uniref:Uncharacterized protein n=1 Tax=Cirrhinus molitorella TaxID=172907 RepID=A0ABR3NAM9_9TELE